MDSICPPGCAMMRIKNTKSPMKNNKTAKARLRACFKISNGPAARDFDRGQGGELRASPKRAVSSEPTQATGKRPAAREVFTQEALWLRCSSVTDHWRVCSLVAPRHRASCAETGPLPILKQALRGAKPVCFDGKFIGYTGKTFRELGAVAKQARHGQGRRRSSVNRIEEKI